MYERSGYERRILFNPTNTRFVHAEQRPVSNRFSNERMVLSRDAENELTRYLVVNLRYGRTGGSGRGRTGPAGRSGNNTRV